MAEACRKNELPIAVLKQICKVETIGDLENVMYGWGSSLLVAGENAVAIPPAKAEQISCSVLAFGTNRLSEQ